MSKFYKTTYSRQPNINNFLSSAQNKREAVRTSQIKSSTINRKQIQSYYHQEETLQKNHHHLVHQLQKKIQIDPTLLFNTKINSKNGTRPIQMNARKNTNRTESKFYQTTTGFSIHKDRPQSKQQPRSRPNNQVSKKSQYQLPQRPQTSKGARSQNLRSGQDVRIRKLTQEDDDDIKINLKGERKLQIATSQSRRNSQSAKINFETSIDPQFLALFAN